jgi:hypothetical protein
VGVEEKDRTHRLPLQPWAVEGAGDADGRRTGILGGIAAVLPLALGCGGAAVVSSRLLRNCRCQGPCVPLTSVPQPRLA